MSFPVLELSLKGNGVSAVRVLPSGMSLGFYVSSLREERTGVHGKLALTLEKASLGWTVCNIDRDDERTRLANKAFKKLTAEQRKGYELAFYQHDLDYFCYHAWATWLEAFMPRQEAGQNDLVLEYLLEPYLLGGGGTILFGPPGAGKSYIGMGMAVSIDSGTSDIWPVHKQPALWVNLERSPASVRWRLAHINTALGLPPDRDLMILHARGKRFKDIYGIVLATIARHSIGFVAVDSLSRMGVGSLVKDEPINEAIDLLNGLGRTWLALGHTPTSEEGHVYGGNLWTAGADITAQLVSIRRPHLTGIRIEAFKSNDTPIGKPLFYALDFHPGLIGLKALRLSSLKEFPELAMKGKRDLVDDLCIYLRDVGSATATQAARDLKSPRNRIAEAFSTRPDIFVRHGPKTQSGQSYALLAPLDIL